MHQNETAQSNRLGKNTETYETSSRNSVMFSYIKFRKKSCLKYYVEAAFAVNLDFKFHTGATFKMGKGAIVSVS